MIESRYYKVQEIRVLENCGRDKAYAIAKELPHEKRGRDIFVFKEDYDRYYEEKRQKAIENSQTNNSKAKVFNIRKFN